MAHALLDVEVLAEACTDFCADPDEPGVCRTCGWLQEEHPAEREV